MVKRRGVEKKSFVDAVLIFIAILILVFVGYSIYGEKPIMTGMATSQVGNLSASVTTYLSCVWSDASLDVNFGSDLNPGIDNINASANYAETASGTSYNLTVDSLSNVNVDVTIKGADLVSGANNIGIDKISWSSSSDSSNDVLMIPENSISLTTDYNEVNKLTANEPIGSSAWFRFWIDVPTGQVAGAYKGNYTMQCVQAS